MRVVENEPLAVPIPWPGPAITSVTQLAEIGISEDGRPVRVLLLRRNVLIGGIAGSGKSGVLNVIIAILAACRDVRAVGRGPERRNGTPAVGQPASKGSPPPRRKQTSYSATR